MVDYSPPPRLRLHIRQQPIATRACSAGEKDRRTIDPPPILQLLMTDFRPDSRTDLATLQNPRLSVACLLYSVGKPGPDGKEVLVHSSQVVETTRRHRRDDGRAHNTYRIDSRTAHHINEQSDPSDQRPVQILSGRTYVSPFYTPYDPDPETAPYQYQHQYHTIKPPPTIFFVFADLSVRTAGLYRLKFRLLDWGLAQETGRPSPILAEIFSDQFRVYSSKDFPGMRASSALTWNLRKMGMTELKPRDGKGKGVAKKEKRRGEDDM
ncbi:uncharacterized protein BHQ10_006634 [Talaromyces amestolkiae]|uniref:Velvet domain-containing protein n=1 Tax=Talaromyces amestolkiae TaxID=1196081 RepID=A0A364L4A2_TALAM|nr:uncharacterized protein BHQ10_006634 [Talaromyces amestolkiae]RAO70622.1 hypothetical protein BHQ10_006634 [Talaromyces amestolkiae]